ncbi:MAG TPA: SLBB domain-containing protein [Candidatus Brocadiia bacterium]|nr:SLBB domain-containing protein [Candidatus Brocadiia bacterium]
MRASFSARVLRLAAALTLCAAAAALAAGGEHVIGPRDVIDIAVRGCDKLCVAVTVGDDGAFLYPMLGRVEAAGKTLSALRETLRTRLADGYVRDPNVEVTLKAVAPREVIVLGEANNTGVVAIRQGMSLIELFARVGGATPNSNGEIVIKRRKGSPRGSEPVSIRASLGSLLSGGADADLALEDGDIVLFGSKAPVGEGKVYVLGEVRRPGVINVSAKGMDLYELVMVCGGVTADASGKIVVRRGETSPGRTQPAKPGAGQSAAEETADAAVETYWLRDLMMGKARDARVYDRDSVFFPKADEQAYYILGQVQRTGRFPYIEGITVFEAVAIAGGYTRIANPKGAVITRRVDGVLKELPVTENTKLAPGDFLRVPESWW